MRTPVSSTYNYELSQYSAQYWQSSFGEWPVYPYCLEDAVRRNHTTFSESNCRYMLVNLILDGEIDFKAGNENKYSLSAGDILVIPQHTFYLFSTTDLMHYRKVVLELKGTLLSELSEQLNLAHPTHITAERAGILTQEILAIGKLLATEDKSLVPDIISKTWEVLTMLSQHNREGTHRERMLAQARSLLENNLSSDFTVADLADKLGISQALLTRRFREHCGVSPQQYRMAYKIKQAEYLITHTDMPMKEIAFRLGYANQLYFSNDFKKHASVSPNTYRARHFGKANRTLRQAWHKTRLTE